MEDQGRRRGMQWKEEEGEDGNERDREVREAGDLK